MTLHRLLLVGCGRMGGALLSAWRREQATSGMEIRVIDPRAEQKTHASLNELPESWHPDAVLFAVKPQTLPQLLPEYASRFGMRPLYLTIAAGRPIEFYEKHLGQGARIIRAMPNAPALVGSGMTVYCGNARAEDNLDTAKELFGAAGAVLHVEEEQMDAATALSGSGPAYMFLMLEALAKAGEAHGLDALTARTLAEQTMLGAARLSLEERGKALEALRAQVASPGGTTEAALSVLTAELPGLVGRAVERAIKRAGELAEK